MSDPKKHTPGPWQVYEPSAMDHSGWEVFPCIDGTRIAMVRLEGDCRLIASAPEMKARIEQLEAALRESVKAMNGMSKMYATVWDRTDECLVVFKENVPRFDNAFCELGDALDNARALIGEAK